MNNWKNTLFWCTLCLLLACETAPTTSTNHSENGNVATDTIAPADQPQSNTNAQPDPQIQDCTIEEKHFEQNVFLATDEAQLITIIANESTEDPNLGESHRILKILNAKNCSSLLEQTLPVNRSADFPYYLVPETYKPGKQVIAIQGFSNLYYYDVKNQNLVGPLTPQFADDRDAVDAQSGMVKGLTIWEQYLLGHALDFGSFAYDISDLKNPKPEFPVARYLIPNTTNYNDLFLLKVEDQTYQAIIPTQDLDAGGNTFDLYKLFTNPLPILPNVAPNVRDNRYLVFNQNGNAAKVVVDMRSKKQIQLPEDIATQNIRDILEWVKTNE